MAYNGFLIKTGDYIIPADRYIRSDSYQAGVSLRTVDTYTDANGCEHIEATEPKTISISFETPALLTGAEFEELMAQIRANYTEAETRRSTVTAYIPETGGYITQSARLADVTPSVYRISSDTVWYNSVRFTWTGGAYDG